MAEWTNPITFVNKFSFTYQDQEKYFSDVISKLFDLNQPSQVLFSYRKMEECIIMEVWSTSIGQIEMQKFHSLWIQPL